MREAESPTSYLPNFVPKLSAADMASKQPQRLPKGFCGMLWQLLVLLRPLPALFLVALSILEAILVFQGGT